MKSRDNYMRFAADLIWMWIALSQLYLGVDSDVVFHQPPVLYALPGDNITLLCVTQSQTNHEGYWQINGLIANANRRSTLQDKGIVYSQYTTNNDSILLTHLSLSIVAYPNNNKTNISCEVYRDHSKSIFIIVGPPLPPHPTLEVRQNGTMLSVSWIDPFTFPGFNITRYTVQRLNKTDMSTSFQDVGLNHTQYVEVIQDVAAKCHDLVFAIMAFNVVGNATNIVSGGFPIIPAPVTVHTVVLYQPNGTPRLEIWFMSAESCSYQEDHYRVDVVNTEGIRVILQPAHYFDYPRTSDNNSLHRYYLDSGLREGANYTVVVIAASLAGSMKSSQGVAIEPLMTYTTCNECSAGSSDHTQVYEAALGLLATIGLTLFVLLITFVCLCFKQRRALNKRLKSETLAGCQLSTPPQKPTSLLAKCAATNPIYDGPMYESPTGEPLRALLGSTPSTPNTPSADSPRYFDMPPPSLPPPRKSSVASVTPCVVQHTLCSAGSVSMVEMESSLNGAFDFYSVADDYTVMRPACSVRKGKPSPLVIPGLAVKHNYT